MMDKLLTSLGTKAVQLSSKIDRTARYRDRLRLSKIKTYQWDVDLVHCVFREDSCVPVCITELTKAEPGRILSEGYRNALIDRYARRDGQGKFIRMVVEGLNVPAYIILFNDMVEEIWIYSFRKLEWRKMNWEEHIDWLNSLIRGK